MAAIARRATRSRGGVIDQHDDFTAWATARWRRLVRAAVVLGCTPAEAEDVVQGALLRAYLTWPRVVRADNPDAYAITIVLNVHRQSRRRRWWGERPVADLPDAATPDHSDAVARGRSLHQALARLSRAQREVVVLRFYGQLTEQETARMLGIPLGTVKSRTSAALGLLAQLLDRDDFLDRDDVLDRGAP